MNGDMKTAESLKGKPLPKHLAERKIRALIPVERERSPDLRLKESDI
jgi:hypothetical protein